MKSKIIFITVSFLIIFSTTVFAQEADENWQEIHRDQQVVFSVQHNASRITKTVNSVIKVQNLNENKVFVQFTPLFYCNGENAEPKTLEKQSTYLGIGEEDKNSLHAFKVCAVGQAPIIKISQLVIGETEELDAAKRVKNRE